MNETKRRSWKRRALFALLAVIFVALGFASVAVARARERARRMACASNLKNGVGYVSHLFAGDHGGHYPPTLGVLYPDYMGDSRGWLCPSAGKATALADDPDFSRDDYTPAMFGDTHTDFVYVSGLRADDPPHYVLAFEDEWNHDGDGVNVLIVSGRVRWMWDIKALHDQLAGQEKELATQRRKMKVLRPAWSSWPDPPSEPRPVPDAQRQERRRELEAELEKWSSGQAARKAEEDGAAEERRRRHAEDMARLAAEDRQAVQQALLALSRDLPPTLTLDLGGGVTMELVLIPAGEFLMGSPRWDGRHDSSNGPQHRARITRPFYMGKYEVTQAQYERTMGKNPSRFKGASLPVDEVSWFDATEFCRKLSQRTGKTVRLPTEAEWEYACRAGTTTYYFFGDGESVDDYAWFGRDSEGRHHPVGGKRANPWGLHDMYENVVEWCSDWYDAGYYEKSPEENPQGPASRPTHWSWGGCRGSVHGLAEARLGFPRGRRRAGTMTWLPCAV